MKKIFITGVITILSVAVYAQHTNLKVLNTYHIPSPGGWDYIAIHAVARRIYVSHTTQVNILDAKTGDSLGVIPNTTGVHGVAFVDALNKGFTSNGRLNNVTVFDLKTNAVIAQIVTGQNPDAIFYDPYSKKVYTCNGRSKDISVIDPATNTVVATIPVGGKPETAVSDEEGKIFVNIEDKSEIAVIDARSYTVINHWTIAPAEEPTGLAIDLKTKKLFAGCGNKMLAVVDAVNGKVETTLPIGAGCDGVAYDSKWKQVYASNGQDGTITIVAADAKDGYKAIATISTKKSARTIAVDETTHRIYLPAADLEANPEPGKRPRMVPGSFQVLVVGEK